MEGLETVKEVLIRRDHLSPEEADSLIESVKEEMWEAVDSCNMMEAEDIFQSAFNLEPDYLIEFLE